VGVRRGEIQINGYARRCSLLKVSGRGFDSRRLHHSNAEFGLRNAELKPTFFSIPNSAFRIPHFYCLPALRGGFFVFAFGWKCGTPRTSLQASSLRAKVPVYNSQLSKPIYSIVAFEPTSRFHKLKRIAPKLSLFKNFRPQITCLQIPEFLFKNLLIVKFPLEKYQGFKSPRAG